MSSEDPAQRSHRVAARRPGGVLVACEDSGGAFALMEYAIPPRTLVAPLHTHSREDEYSYVLAGEIGAQIGEETRIAVAGELVGKPRGVPHALWNASDAPARVLELIVPGGFDHCLAELYRPHERPSPERLQALWAAYGIEMHADSQPGLIERHHLDRCALAT